MSSARCFSLLLCLFTFRSFSQYYPAQTPVPRSQLHDLLRQAHSPSTVSQHIHSLNALANLYLNLPLRKTADLHMAEQYGRQALSGSIKMNDRTGEAEALLLLGQLYVVTNTPDSIEGLLSLADDSTRAKLLLQLSFYYWFRDSNDKSRDYLKSIDCAKQASVLGERLGLKDLVLLSRRNIAMDDLSSQKDSTEAGMLEVLHAYEQAGYKKLHYIYFPLAWDFNNRGRLDKAYYYSEAAIKSVLETKDTLATGDMYVIKGVVDYLREKYADAVHSGELALKFYSSQAGMYAASSPEAHDIITAAYDKMGKKEEAINYIIGVLHQYPPRGMEDSLAILNRIGHAYREMKRFKEAEDYFRQAYAISMRAHFDERQANINLGQVYLDEHQYDKSREYLYKAAAMKSTGEPSNILRHLHYMIFLADSATQHYLSAIQHLNIYNDQAAADARLEKDKVVKKMEVAYKSLEKEDEIKLQHQNITLLQKQADAQKEKIKQSQLIAMLTAGGFALSLLILILLVFLYRQKQQGNREMAEKNQLLQTLVSEKDWLLKEVHHRVKNNLHTIFCLLESQARTASPEARSALEKSQQRIYAMSLFHQKAYQSDNIEQVDFGNYIRDFLIFLQDGFDLETRNIRIVHEMEAVTLPLRLAMPLALIANEALTNAAKYAFEGRSAGEIRLSLRKEEQTYVMTISDNGIGMIDPGLSLNRSLGMELMHGLCADIGAAIHFEVEKGTRINIRFESEEIIEQQSNIGL